MRITVKLVGRLGRRGVQSPQTLSVQAGTTVGEVVKTLGLRPGDVWLITVNGRFAEDDQPLQPEDDVVLIPPVGGGD
jgi:molybdopterin converting factor small subunit